jgi:hypothetical protein
MAKKNFQSAPKTKNAVSLEAIEAFESGVILRCVALHAVLKRRCIVCGRSILNRFVGSCDLFAGDNEQR